MIRNLLLGEITQEDILNYYNASIVYKELPIEVYGYVFNRNDIYCIVINDNLSYYKKKKTILHELAHIELNQLCQSNKDMFEYHRKNYEDEADKYIKSIKESMEV